MDKKKLIQLGIIATVSATGLAGCEAIQKISDDFNPFDNENQDVYGPPVEDDDFDVEDNENSCVYGPPEEVSDGQD